MRDSRCSQMNTAREWSCDALASSSFLSLSNEQTSRTVIMPSQKSLCNLCAASVPLPFSTISRVLALEQQPTCEGVAMFPKKRRKHFIRWSNWHFRSTLPQNTNSWPPMNLWAESQQTRAAHVAIRECDQSGPCYRMWYYGNKQVVSAVCQNDPRSHALYMCIEEDHLRIGWASSQVKINLNRSASPRSMYPIRD